MTKSSPPSASWTKKRGGKTLRFEGFDQQRHSYWKKFTISYPNGWLASSDVTNGIVKLEREGYVIAIYQVIGAGSCIFPDEKEPASEGMWSKFGDFVEITMAGKTFRREKASSDHNFVFCEKRNSGFVALTSFGQIRYEVPANESAEILQEMDSILKTIKPI